MLIDGRAPRAGQVFANPRLAATLEILAREGREAFYRGSIAQKIAADSRAAAGTSQPRIWPRITRTGSPRSRRITAATRCYELPPNNQGIVALEMLNILEGFDLKSLGHNSAEYLHLMVEAKRIAFADRNAYLADPAFVPDAGAAPAAVEGVRGGAAQGDRPLARGRRLQAWARCQAGPRSPRHDDAFDGRDQGDTIYLTAADDKGNVISLIQSLYETFGAGIVAGDTGIVLHDRGAGFRLDAGHPDRIAPGKRPMHTLVPAMVMKDGKPWLSFGVMGGDMQPQGHAQVLANLIDFGMNVQEAGEAPRFRHMPAGVALESAIPRRRAGRPHGPRPPGDRTPRASAAGSRAS